MADKLKNVLLEFLAFCAIAMVIVLIIVAFVVLSVPVNMK